jgi:hypothetical protein
MYTGDTGIAMGGMAGKEETATVRFVDGEKRGKAQSSTGGKGGNKSTKPGVKGGGATVKEVAQEESSRKRTSDGPVSCVQAALAATVLALYFAFCFVLSLLADYDVQR